MYDIEKNNIIQIWGLSPQHFAPMAPFKEFRENLKKTLEMQ